MAQDLGEPVSPPQKRILKVLEKPHDPPRHYYLEHARVDYIISPNGDVDTNLLMNAPYDDFVTRLEVMKKINVDQIPTDVLVTVVDDIATQVQKEVSKPHLSNEEFDRIRHSQGAIANLLTNYRHNPSIPFPSQAIRKIKDLYVANPLQNIGAWEMQYIEQSNVAKLIVLDERNSDMGNERLGIKEEVAGEILTELRSLPPDYPVIINGRSVYPYNTERRTLAYTLACGKAATREIMYQFLQEQAQIPAGFLQVLGNALGFETVRAYINEYVRTHPSSREKLEKLSKQVGLDSGEKVFFDLKEFYQTIEEEASWGDYSPNLQLQQRDLDFLHSELPRDGLIIDVGFRGGRHLIPLLKEGYRVEGIEIDETTFGQILKEIPDAKLKLGSMNNLPYEDASVDAVYILGRTIADITSINEAIAIFREFRRVLKDGGVVLLDLPNSGSQEMREYLEQRHRYLWDKLHIWNKESGAVHDSPDGKYYTDRSLWPHIYEVALLAGFDARIMKKIPYTGASGKEAENEYWKMAIRSQEPLKSEVEELQPLKDLVPSGNRGLEIDNY